MANNQPSRPDDSSSLRDRIGDILRPGSSSRGPLLERDDGLQGAPNESHDSHDHDGTDAADERTRLLENYERRQSICGLRDCNHGTFSPKPEEHEPGSLVGSYLWASRTPRLLSGLQTPVTDGTSVTNRLAAEMGLKDRRRMYARPSTIAQYHQAPSL